MASYKKGTSGNPSGRAIGTKCQKTLLKEAIVVVSNAMSDVSLPVGLRVTAAIAVIESQNLKKTEFKFRRTLNKVKTYSYPAIAKQY